MAFSKRIGKLEEAICSHLAAKAESGDFPSSAFLATISNLKTSLKDREQQLRERYPPGEKIERL